MKISFFIPSFRGGGAERVMVTLANSLQSKGHAVTVLVVNNVGPYKQEVHDSVQIYSFNKSRTILCIFPLLRYIRKTRPEAVISTMTHVNLVAIIAWILSGIKSVKILAREANAPLSRYEGSIQLKARIQIWMMKMLYPLCTAVLAVSKDVERELHLILGEKKSGNIKLFHNPVFSPDLIDLMKKKPQHEWLTGRDRKWKIIIAMGRLEYQKGFDTLLNAFTKLREDIHVKLIILGEGSLRKKFEIMANELGISDRVSLPGFTENPYAELANSDLFVLSSRWEGLPNALIQAMACNIPVLSTNCPGGPAEILEDGKWGQLVPVDDVAALTEAISDELTSPMCVETQRRAEYFSVDNSVNLLESILME